MDEGERQKGREGGRMKLHKESQTKWTSAQLHLSLEERTITWWCMHHKDKCECEGLVIRPCVTPLFKCTSVAANSLTMLVILPLSLCGFWRWWWWWIGLSLRRLLICIGRGQFCAEGIRSDYTEHWDDFHLVVQLGMNFTLCGYFQIHTGSFCQVWWLWKPIQAFFGPCP